MERDTKFGYGYTLVGIGAAYLLDKLFGPAVAMSIAIGLTLLGIAFLVAGHRHELATTAPSVRSVRLYLWPNNPLRLTWKNSVILSCAMIAGVAVIYGVNRIGILQTIPFNSPPSLPVPNVENIRESALVKNWQIKGRWRELIKVGMTKNQVRQVFGNPEHVSVMSDLEDWDYGSGTITFIGGEVYSWYEPTE